MAPSTPAGPGAGQLARHPVMLPDGSVRHQVVLVVTDPDEAGNVRGFPVGYEDEAAQFAPAQLA